MIRCIKTRRSIQETISDKIIPDNWWGVYLESARMDGRRIRFISNGVMEIIFAEKDYTLTLVRI